MKQILLQVPLLQVLRLRPFFWLWSAQLLTYVVANMLTFVLGVLVYSQTRLNTHVSLLYLAIGIPATVFGLGSGLIVDALNKKRLLFTSTILRAVILLLILINHQHMNFLLLAVALFTTFGQIFIPAEASLIPQIVPSHLLFAANSLFTMTFYASIIGGFVLGGPLMSILGNKVVMTSFVVAYGLAAALILMLPHNLGKTNHNGTMTLVSVLDDFRFLFKFVQQTTYVGRALLLMTVLQVVVTIFMILGPGFVDKILHIKLTDASVVLLGPAAGGMILGALSMGILGSKFQKRTLIFAGVLISGILLLLLTLYTVMLGVPSSTQFLTQEYFPSDLINTYLEQIRSVLLPLTIFTMFMLGICISLIDISCNTILQERTSDEVRGRVYGMLSTLISGVSLLPVVVSGVLADIIGIEKIIFALGMLLLGFGVYIGKKYPAS